MNRENYTAELELNIKRLKYLINQVSGNFYWKDLDGFYKGCNINVVKSFEQADTKGGISLNSSDDIVGMSNYDLFNDRLADDLTANDLRVIRSDEEQVFIESYFDKNDKKRFWFSKKKPFYDNKGVIKGIVGFAHEITQDLALYG